MSTKLVPFTTRPLSTSRQGMTRLSSMAAFPQEIVGLLDGEPALVERLAGDHAGEVPEPQLLQRAQVVERGDAARVEEAAADHAGHLLYLVEIRPGQHPVAVHVRVDELLHAAPLQAADPLVRRHLRALLPAIRRHPTLAHVPCPAYS